MFDIAIQTGAILAVILVYWHKIRDTEVALPRQTKARRFARSQFLDAAAGRDGSDDLGFGCQGRQRKKGASVESAASQSAHERGISPRRTG